MTEIERCSRKQWERKRKQKMTKECHSVRVVNDFKSGNLQLHWKVHYTSKCFCFQAKKRSVGRKKELWGSTPSISQKLARLMCVKQSFSEPVLKITYISSLECKRSHFYGHITTRPNLWISLSRHNRKNESCKASEMSQTTVHKCLLQGKLQWDWLGEKSLQN